MDLKRSACKKTLAVLLLLALGIVGVILDRPNPVRSVFAPARVPDWQVVLDAGHGGEDGGAVSVSGAPESQINLEITLKLEQILGFYGISPILLRREDKSLHDEGAETIREKKVSDLHNRVSMIEGIEHALVVSVHQNTFPDPSLHGCQVFYRAEGESQVLAELIQSTVQTCLDQENRRKAVKIPSSVYLMKHITCPAVLVECGFLSNPEEEARLHMHGYQLQVSFCIVSGILQKEKNNPGGMPKTVL